MSVRISASSRASSIGCDASGQNPGWAGRNRSIATSIRSQTPRYQREPDHVRHLFPPHISHVQFASSDSWTFPQPKPTSQVEINEPIEPFVLASKADIRHGGYLAGLAKS